QALSLSSPSNPQSLMPNSGTASPSSTNSTDSSASFSTSTDRPRLCSSLTSTLNDSGTPGSSTSSPLTIASYAFTRPTTSSDLTVSNSCKMCAAPYASSAHTSISPKRWPPNCALPPSGCCVMREYGPVLRAWILSSTRWTSFNM